MSRSHTHGQENTHINIYTDKNVFQVSPETTLTLFGHARTLQQITIGMISLPNLFGPLWAYLDINVIQEKSLIASPSRALLQAYLEVFVTIRKSCSTPQASRDPIQTSLLHREEGLPPQPILSPLHYNQKLTPDLNGLTRCYPEVLCLWSYTHQQVNTFKHICIHKQ